MKEESGTSSSIVFIASMLLTFGLVSLTYTLLAGERVENSNGLFFCIAASPFIWLARKQLTFELVLNGIIYSSIIAVAVGLYDGLMPDGFPRGKRRVPSTPEAQDIPFAIIALFYCGFAFLVKAFRKRQT